MIAGHLFECCHLCHLNSPFLVYRHTLILQFTEKNLPAYHNNSLIMSLSLHIDIDQSHNKAKMGAVGYLELLSREYVFHIPLFSVKIAKNMSLCEAAL